jgi:dTMP kinase
MLITFEGIDSSGKSTQARILVERLRQSSPRPVHFIREPGGTAVSERVRTILLDPLLPELSDVSEFLLFAASRAQLVREVILPALSRDEYVVCDRFADSSVAYQGFGRGIELDKIHAINALATARTEPDLTVLVDITVEESYGRKQKAGTALDRVEQSGKAFYDRVRNGYLAMAKEHPARVLLIDGTRGIESIAAEIEQAVRTRHERIKREQE